MKYGLSVTGLVDPKKMYTNAPGSTGTACVSMIAKIVGEIIPKTEQEITVKY